MKEYHKIETLFVRDDKFKVTDQLRNPVYGTIDPWIVTEKIDGTNIRVCLTEENEIRIGGRTDKAQLHVELLEYLQKMFTVEKMMSLRQDEEPIEITLYGEGFGAGIQKGGGRYRPTKQFILFDVLVGGKWWLEDSAVTEIAEKLGVERVPILGTFTLKEIISMVKTGLMSQVADDKEFLSEGVVARPIQPLFDRRGKRVIIKLKTHDFS